MAMLASPTLAKANDTNDPTTATDGTTTSQSDAQGDDQSGTQADYDITIDQATPVVTAKSGYHITFTINNHTNQATEAGTAYLNTNLLFTFVSRTDMQNWAEHTAGIPTPDSLGTVQVPAIAANGSATVSINVSTSQQTLAALGSWGPKPLMLSYITGNQLLAALPTFLTRSSDGLTTAQTPAMNLTVAVPFTSSAWQVDEDAVKQRIAETDEAGDGSSSSSKQSDDANTANNTGNDSGKSAVTEDGKAAAPATPKSSETDGAQSSPSSDGTGAVARAITLSDNDADTASELGQTFAKHRSLQVVADPQYLQESAVQPSIAAIMQPSDFDITTYAAVGDDEAYRKAGISTEQWSADRATSLYKVSGKTEKSTPIAWQGSDPWTLDALTAARTQGYSTVIADASFDADQTDAVHTGTYVVNTDAGDVTVLKEQAVLGTLAKGQATSDSAAAETSDAGRLARLMAQSAFYQMEQPYTSRYLLMTFSRSDSAAWIDAVMSALEQASWLNLTDLNTMAQAEPYSVGSDVNVDDSQAADATVTRSTLNQLATSRADIMRMAGSILKNELNSSEASSLDPQALARQDANSTATHTSDPTAWIGSLLAIHDDMAVRALTGAADTDASTRMTTGAQTLASELLNSVHINPSESVSVFSESAKMPITISNDLPYAVHIRVNSITDSMQIVTSRDAEVSIPAHSDAQVTFTIRVSTSGSTTAHVTMTDREGNSFGNTQNTAITSVMRISDASGFIIIGFAVLLGIVGLWRQFHRKKDPDE
ncbi:DUF6049 family protein [Bifidobacterium scaligerum]|uniref:Uncharacterized protein n=1 Tax=Bifidobacterium scaligerum TaxID=2052656 RepID=A0A2M9HND5_9BIFI|nr:DUF6049 family protein [Bifidobacterium scaligerum]PJM78328.1 hypothetical protein CUU80_10140 [Bifidobacterium scaligerum]